MVSRTLNIAKESKLHRDLIKRLESRIRLGEQDHNNQHYKWSKAEEITLAYVPEREADAARNANKEQGLPEYTTIQIPYSYALLMSAHTYLTSVFFARTPVHQYSGRHGEAERQVQALEALIGYQVEVGSFLGPYYVWLYDTLKYGHGVLGEYWCEEKIYYGQIVEMETSPGIFQLMQSTTELPGYQGNRVYNVSPYDFIHDPRVPLRRFQEGEFCAARCRLGWDKILERKNSGYFMNIDRLKQHDSTDRGSSMGSSQIIRPDFSRKLYEGEEEKDGHPAGAVFWEIYVRLIPNEWKVGPGKNPEIWCFTVTEDMGLIVGASPIGYMHAKFPFNVLQSEIEGYGLFTRGVPEIMQPIQETMDWLINTHFYNTRAALNNQFIVDPSKLVIKDVVNTGPGFIWRLKPEAYGTDLRSMFMQVPVNDVTRQHMTDLQQMFGIGERTLGINDQIMGMLSPGGRKTATEIRTSTGFGVNRLKTITEYMSGTGFAQHSQKLVQNSQQFYDMQAKLRRVGDLVLEAGEGFINVDPHAITGFFDFIPVDGTLPVDRIAQANLWKEMMMGLQRMPPQIVMGYDWGRIFGWVAQLSGLKNINQFKIQVMPPGAQPQGNVVPMPDRGGGVATPGAAASTAAGLNALVPQMGGMYG
jgi:hypothetical protein